MELLDTSVHEVTPTKSHGCTQCPYTATTKRNLTRHTRRSHGPKEFQCGHCDQSFGLLTDAKKHEEIHSDTKYLCPTCGKSYKSKGGIREHTLLKHSDVPFKCQICQKAFGRESHLTYHMESCHDNVKQYKCKYCPKEFGSRDNRRKHEHICGARPITQTHKCSICGKVFKSIKYLQQHIQGKHSSKQWLCDTEGCSEIFGWQTALSRHKKKCGKARMKV